MRRICILLLAVLLLLVWAVPVFASVPQKIKGLHPQLTQALYYIELDGEMLSVDWLSALEVKPGSELRIYLLGKDGGSLFADQNGNPIPTADVSVSRLQAAKISVNAPQEERLGVVESVAFAYSDKTDLLPSAAPYIGIRFVPELASLEDIIFTLPLTISIGGGQNSEEIILSGSITIDELSISRDETAIDLSGGAIAVPEENMRNVRIFLGDGVFLTANLEKDKRYFAVATLEAASSTQESVSVEMVRVYSLKAIGFDNEATWVQIESDRLLHVYAEDGAYLGTTRDQVPYSEQYYLVNRKMPSFIR